MPSKPRWNVIGGASVEGIEENSTDSLSDESHHEDGSLPDDLNAVASQLADDAIQLASRFPAGFASSGPVQNAQFNTARSNLRWTHIFVWQRVAVATLLVAVGAAAATLAHRALTPRDAAIPISPTQQFVGAGTSRELVRHNRVDITAEPANPAGIQEVDFDSSRTHINRNELEMLRIQVGAFEQVIQKLQNELAQREKSQADNALVIESLRQEVRDLRRQVDEQKNSGLQY